jgi:hypothetical protein
MEQPLAGSYDRAQPSSSDSRIEAHGWRLIEETAAGQHCSRVYIRLRVLRRRLETLHQLLLFTIRIRQAAVPERRGAVVQRLFQIA